MNKVATYFEIISAKLASTNFRSLLLSRQVDSWSASVPDVGIGAPFCHCYNNIEKALMVLHQGQENGPNLQKHSGYKPHITQCSWLYRNQCSAVLDATKIT